VYLVHDDSERHAPLVIAWSVSDGDTRVESSLSVEMEARNDAPHATEQGWDDVNLVDVWTFPDDAFADPDGDPLAYSVSLANGARLPDWLEFDSETREFHAVGEVSETQSVEVLVRAEDSSGEAASRSVRITIEPPAIDPVVPVEEVQPVVEVVPETDTAVVEVVDETEVELVPAAAQPTAQPATQATTQATTPAESRPTAQVTQQDADQPTAPPVVTEQLTRVVYGELSEGLRSGQSDEIDIRSLLAMIDIENKAIAPDRITITERLVSIDRAQSPSDSIPLTNLDALILVLERSDGVVDPALSDALDRQRDQEQQAASFAQTLIGSSVGVTSGLSVGYLIWLLRGGTLVGSMLSSLPAWRFVDPLPVLGSLGDVTDDEDEESLQSIVNSSKGSQGLQSGDGALQ
jgi:hypothetical protein